MNSEILRKNIILIPPACAPRGLWRDYIDHFSAGYRVIVPSLEGHNDVKSEHYTSTEDNAWQISEHLQANYKAVFLLWVVSDEANIALKLVAMNAVV